MNVLVTGANGQLGNEFRVLAKKNKHVSFLFTDASALDITNKMAVQAFFDTHQIAVCINCAAYTAVDNAETDKELCDFINVTGAQNLAQSCRMAKARMIHVSTDFVFDGNSAFPLTEDQQTSPVNYYGASKLNGELAVANALEEHFIIRTSWLYSSFGKNFVKTMIFLGENKDRLNIIVDQVGTPTYARDLAQTILTFIESDSTAYGTYHYSNEGVASWYDFTSAIFEYENIKTPVSPIPTTAYPTPAKRPHYSVMDKTKIKSTLNIEIAHWRDSLKDCLTSLRNLESH